MMAKDSVKNRLETGMSFTEFSYQLLQAFDFYKLYTENNCRLQMGGSDQWGNITSGAELIRRKCGGEAYALTTILIKKSDGSKFGKSEGGNIWLDRNKTSPYKFYQFWINTSDEDAKNYIKVFTFLDKETIDSLIEQHAVDPGKRILQKTLAKEITILVHSEDDYNTAVKASAALFNGTLDDLKHLNEETFVELFEGIPQFEIAKSDVDKGILVVDLLAEKTNVFPSKGEARKLIQNGGLSLNRQKVESHDLIIDKSHLINSKYLVVQKGKKNYYLFKVN